MSGGRRVSCVVVLKRAPLLMLLLPLLRPPSIGAVELKEPCAALWAAPP